MTDEYKQMLISNFNEFVLSDDFFKHIRTNTEEGEDRLKTLCRVLWIEATKQADERHAIK